MAIELTGPSVFHSAFNPVIFTATSDVPQATPYTLILSIGKVAPDNATTPPGAPGRPYDENIVLLTRPFMKVTDTEYVAKFDVSGVIRNFFKLIPPAMSKDVEVDERLYVQYYVGTTMYVAINAIFGIGEDSSMDNFKNKILSGFSYLRYYPGYDFDVSILGASGAPYWLTENAVNRVKRDFIPVEYLYDDEKNNIIDLDGDKITVNGTRMVEAAVPRNPFYIRWINRLGGVDYWMFGIRQTLGIDIKGVNTLKSYYETSGVASNSETTYGVTAENTVTVGSDNLSEEEWNVLSLLPMSPQIEWYNKKLKKWQIINIKKGKVSRDTDCTLLTIELTFLLPGYDVQFS